MNEHQDQFLPFGNALIARRDFIKWAGALGLSAGALEALFSQQGIAFAKAQDVTDGLVGYWKLDDGSGATAVDSVASANNGTLTGGPTWTTGRINGALSLNGSSTEVDINKSVLDTSQSYTVSAWVQLSNPNVWATAVSQDGANVSGFYLQYTNPGLQNADARFAFSLISADSTSATAIRAISEFHPLTNFWYQIAGVYDATNNQIHLYVNGSLVNTQSVPAAWNAGGETVIGRGKYGGNPVDFWPGLIDDVRVYNRALSNAEVRNIYTSAPVIPPPTGFTPVRPPSTPLVVRNPYVSTWLDGDLLPGNWPRFWTGAVKALTGIASVDGTPYIFMGAPAVPGLTHGMAQTNLEVTPTQSIFTLQGGGVTLTVTFLSPVEVDDIQKQSVPLSYITAYAQSNDGKTHTVSLYFDISGEWAYGDSNALINWGSEQVSHTQGNLTAFTITPNTPQVLAEENDYPSWGTVVWATDNGPNVTTQSGQDTVVRGLFATQGKLNNTMDTDMPRAISDRWPVFAFAANLGNVTTHKTDSVVLVLGHVREPAVSYLGNPVPPLWKSYWATWEQMLAATYDDTQGAFKRSNKLDRMITIDATKANGKNYAALCDLALRQAFGGTELVGTASQPWLFLKEISSDGNVSTIDVMYPAMPVFVYTNPYLLKLLLDPLLAYAETGGWPKQFAEHDIGAHYPNAAGHNDGNEEDMPVEESANMLLMVAAYMRFSAKSDASAYATTHYKILKQWADYLVQNALDPGFQNQTDDFTGFIAHSSNLALKGILALGAMGQIATFAGNTADASYYQSTASSYISQWVTKSQDSSGKHLKLAYDQDGTWSLKYNAFPDKLLGLNLIPAAVLAEEAAWYTQQENPFGIPLDIRHTYTKADWEMWTAASTDVASLRQYFVDSLYAFAWTTGSRVPFTDWYDTVGDVQVGFQARPVMGGLFSILARLKNNK